MKSIITFAVCLTIMASCSNFPDLNPFDSNKEDTPNLCPTVNADAVPATVTSAFRELYPGMTVTTWFNKDNTGYCALFTDNGVQKLVRINNDGTFVSEELTGDQQQGGDFQDNNSDSSNNSDTGCECDTESD